jgi:pyruvate/2-oxoglutarate dehydrogenase complex dihydrolipoamide dehydrogenase (E3) component
MTRVRRVIADVEQDESPELLSKEGIDLVQGWASFTSPHSIDVDGQRLTASRSSWPQALTPPCPRYPA